MMQIHPQARTTPAVRAEIARSTEPASLVAKRYGISDETVRKWRKRGEQACQDRSSRPKKLPWRVTEEERAIICAVRRATGFPLDDLTFVLRHFLPHLNRDNIYRVLRAEGLNRRPAKPSTLPAKGQGRFREYDLGYIHIDVKHLQSCGPPTVRYESAICMSRSTAAPALCTSPSTMRKMQPTRSLSWQKRERRSPSASPMCSRIADPASPLMISNAPVRSSKSPAA